MILIFEDFYTIAFLVKISVNLPLLLNHCINSFRVLSIFDLSVWNLKGAHDVNSNVCLVSSKFLLQIRNVINSSKHSKNVMYKNHAVILVYYLYVAFFFCYL